jgi:hypothetical protein
MTATLFSITPMAATRNESMTRTMNTAEILAVSTTSAEDSHHPKRHRSLSSRCHSWLLSQCYEGLRGGPFGGWGIVGVGFGGPGGFRVPLRLPFFPVFFPVSAVIVLTSSCPHTPPSAITLALRYLSWLDPCGSACEP